MIVGDIFETLPRTLAEWPNKIALVICDLDVGNVTKFVLQHIWDRISPGGLVCFDQYSRNGWSETTGKDEVLAERGLNLALLKKGPGSPAAFWGARAAQRASSPQRCEGAAMPRRSRPFARARAVRMHSAMRDERTESSALRTGHVW